MKYLNVKGFKKFSILMALFVGGFVGYAINQSFKVSEYRQINLLLQDIQDYIYEMHTITDLASQGLTLAGEACKLECARNIACYSDTIQEAGNLDGQLKVHSENAEHLRRRVNERYKSIWLDDFVKVSLEQSEDE